jgi:NDP-sugar pyrophosphorylase family protein
MDKNLGTEYHSRFAKYLKWVQENDLAVSGALTEPRGDRKKRAIDWPDPFLSLKVVEKKPDLLVFIDLPVDQEWEKLKEIVEKPNEPKSNIVNTGIYAFTTEIFSFIEAQLDIPDALNNMLAQGYPISAQEIDGTWLDVVYPWDILSLNDAVLRQMRTNLGGTIERGVSLKEPVSIGKNTVIRSNAYIVGPVVIGNNCD